MIRPDVTVTLSCAPHNRSLYATASVTIEARAFAGDAPLEPTDPRVAAAVQDAIVRLERAVERWLAVPRSVASGPGDAQGNPCPLCGAMDRSAPSPCAGGFHLPEPRG